jgi:F-box/leucine-rich repeat protein 2/20
MNMDAEGIQFMATAAIARGEHLQLKELRVSGLKHTRDSMMEALGKAAPYLEILDLSYARRLHNSALEAFVACDDVEEERLDRLGVPTVMVSARDLGREMTDVCYFRRRVTRLRHLNLSSCILLTDTACTNLAYSVPRLEFFEMAGIGSDLKEAGLIKLFDQTPFIKRIDLEDALDVGDSLLATLTPAPQDQPVGGSSSDSNPPQVGHALQHLNIASALNVRDHGMLSLIRGCPKLIVLEADGTTMSSNVLREFVRLSKERKACDAKIVGVDCRGVGENVVKELAGSTRPRQGWRSYASRRLYYLDSRDGNEEDLKIGQDECDESRVVLKSFYSWQTVDAVKANREKRKKASGGANGRRAGNGSSGSEYDDVSRGGRTRWWSPGGSRGGSGRTSPLALTEFNEGCRAM